MEMTMTIDELIYFWENLGNPEEVHYDEIYEIYRQQNEYIDYQ